VVLVDLLVGREVRNRRRITRAKQTTQEWRDMVDQIPEDQTIRQAADADYRYIGVDTTDLDVASTVQRIKDAIPEVYQTSGSWVRREPGLILGHAGVRPGAG